MNAVSRFRHDDGQDPTRTDKGQSGLFDMQARDDLTPAFDDRLARSIVEKCVSPPSRNPKAAGLKAAFAVYHRHHFESDEQAWSHYDSSKQRYFEWKKAVDELKRNEFEGVRSEADVRRRVDGDLHVCGNLTVDGSISVNGIVMASEVVETAIANEFVDGNMSMPMSSPPPSIPASPPSASKTPTPQPTEVATPKKVAAEKAAAEKASADETDKATGAIAAGTGAVVGGAGAVAAVPAVVTSMGFGSGGIAAGSTAAVMMSEAAIASGGGVAARSTVATLQSIGAAGLSAGPAACVAVAGAAAGAVLLGGLGFSLHKAVHDAYAPSPKRFEYPELISTPRAVEGAQRGKWMVLTEEGWGNVVFYMCESEAQAYRFFYNLRVSRPKVLFDPSGEEKESGGWNQYALPTIRSQYGNSNRFVRAWGDSVDSGGGPMRLADLPPEWESERFTVVDAGGGEIALYNATHRRFVRMDQHGKVDGGGGPKAQHELGKWCLERFTVVDAGEGRVALHGRTANRFVRMHGPHVDGGGGRRDRGSLPPAWEWERFAILKC